MSVLSVRDLSIRFGGLQALADVNIEVSEWEIVGLIGPNGAGKTTFFNCVMGVYTPTTGSVSYRDTDMTALPTYKRCAMGIGRTFQNIGLVKSLPVLENMLVGQHRKARYSPIAGLLGLPSTFREERVLKANALEILHFMGLLEYRDYPVSKLPYGLQKLTEIAVVLSGDPDFLMLDEPTSGMSPEEAHQFGDLLLKLRAELNLTVLMIEHHVPLVVAVCDQVYCLNFGKLLAEGTPDEIREHPEVVAAYLGTEA